jgi:hypothetical protein
MIYLVCLFIHLHIYQNKKRKKPPTTLSQQTGNILFRMFCAPPAMIEVEYEVAFIVNTSFMQGVIIPEKCISIISACYS